MIEINCQLRLWIMLSCHSDGRFITNSRMKPTPKYVQFSPLQIMFYNFNKQSINNCFYDGFWISTKHLNKRWCGRHRVKWGKRKYIISIETMDHVWNFSSRQTNDYHWGVLIRNVLFVIIIDNIDNPKFSFGIRQCLQLLPRAESQYGVSMCINKFYSAWPSK